MKKSVENSLIDFLRSNPSKFASGDLQRREWRNRNGTLATPRSIVRRLEENTYWEQDTPAHKKNLNGVLLATYEGDSTYYQIKEGCEKKVQVVEQLENGRVRVNYVPVTPNEEGVAVKKIETRTDRQNRSLHLWLTMLSDTLNSAGLDQRRVLKPSVSIPWTKESAKEQLWRPIQEAMFEKKSTTELSKTEVGKVEEVLTRHLAQKFGVECPIWPHYEEGEYENETSS